MNRIFNFLTSFLFLLILSPALLITACLVRFQLGSPVIFSQQRPGLHGKPFKMFKFRTMTNDCDKHGNLLPNEDRITSLGSFLRKTSLDELPELINVLKGEMSLVGPRPLLMEYLGLYDNFQMRRHEVRPGITGWAQINGRNAISWEEKFQLDVWYVDHRNFLLDIKILLLTICKVLKRDGIAHEGNVAMPRFTGSIKEGKTPCKSN